MTDTALSEPVRTAPADAVLLFDGVFLMRPELIDRWDLRIFVSATFERTLDRARTRDQAPSRSATEVERRYRSRYIPSQQFYVTTVPPPTTPTSSSTTTTPTIPPGKPADQPHEISNKITTPTHQLTAPFVESWSTATDTRHFTTTVHDSRFRCAAIHHDSVGGCSRSGRAGE